MVNIEQLTSNLNALHTTLINNLTQKDINCNNSESITTLINKIPNITSRKNTLNNTGETNKLNRLSFIDNKSSYDRSLTYDSTNKRYVLYNGTEAGDPGYCIKLGLIPFYENMEISLDMYTNNRSNYYNFYMDLTFSNDDSISYSNYYRIGIYSFSTILRKAYNGTTEQINPSSTLSIGVWYTYKFTFQNGNITLSVINKDTGTTVHTTTYTQIPNVELFHLKLWLNMASSTTYFKNLIIKYNNILHGKITYVGKAQNYPVFGMILKDIPVDSVVYRSSDGIDWIQLDNTRAINSGLANSFNVSTDYGSYIAFLGIIANASKYFKVEDSISNQITYPDTSVGTYEDIKEF